MRRRGLQQDSSIDSLTGMSTEVSIEQTKFARIASDIRLSDEYIFLPGSRPIVFKSIFLFHLIIFQNSFG